MKSILFIGPFPEPTTGVSLANQVLAENIKRHQEIKVQKINTSFAKFDEKLGAFSFSKLLFYLRLNFYAYKIIKSNIVYITPGQTFFGVLKYALFICGTKLLNKELIVHVHGNHLGKEYSLLSGLKKQVFKTLLSCTSKGIVLSESLIGNMSPFIPFSKIFILYNFVEDYLFEDKSILIKKSKEKGIRIFFLSNLMEEKGIFNLLEALLKLEEDGFNYEAKIAGNIDDTHKERILSYFKKLKHTKYIGVVSGQKKKDLLLWGNVFILPTFYTMEGQPISILEAMATANLVITTKHAGIPDVFENDVNGFYINKQDPESIVDKIKKANNNTNIAEKIRQTNFLTAIEKYKTINFIEGFKDIIQT